MTNGDEKNGENRELDAAGQPVARISIDQAVRMAFQYARENREFYGRHADSDLVWWFVSADETDDHYVVRLSYSPSREFHGRLGIDQFTIDKSGQMALRRIVRQPGTVWTSRIFVGSVGALAVVFAAVGVLFVSGVLSPSPGAPVTTATSPPAAAPTSTPAAEPTSTPAAPQRVAIALIPDRPARLRSPDRSVMVDVPAGSVASGSKLIYRSLSSAEIPALPPPFRSTGKAFDLTADTTLLKPITITVEISGADILLAQEEESNIVMQHHLEGDWTQLDTRVNFSAAIATSRVDHLSIFALTVKEPPPDQMTPGSTVAATSEPYRKGVAHYRAGKYRLAIDEFDAAIKQDPDVRNYYWSRGNAHLGLTNLPEAIADYSAALGLDPENATLHHLRGSTYRRDGRFVEALSDLDEAIRLNSDYALAYNTRGDLYALLKIEKESKSDYDKACLLDSQYCR